MPDKKTQEPVEETTMCDVIRYLNDLENPLRADCDPAPREIQQAITDNDDRITGFSILMPGDDACTSAEYDAYSVLILGEWFETDCYANPEEDGIVWEDPYLKVGDTSKIQDVIEKYQKELDEDDDEEERIKSLMMLLIHEKVSCPEGEYEFSVEEVLDVLNNEYGIYYKSLLNGGIYGCCYNDEEELKESEFEEDCEGCTDCKICGKCADCNSFINRTKFTPITPEQAAQELIDTVEFEPVW